MQKLGGTPNPRKTFLWHPWNYWSYRTGYPARWGLLVLLFTRTSQAQEPVMLTPSIVSGKAASRAWSVDEREDPDGRRRRSAEVRVATTHQRASR